MSPVRDSSEWHFYESTSRLRDECRSGELARHIPPEFHSKSFPVSKNELELAGAALGVHLDANTKSSLTAA